MIGCQKVLQLSVGLNYEDLTYLGVPLFALEAALSRFSVRFTLCDALFLHVNDFVTRTIMDAVDFHETCVQVGREFGGFSEDATIM